MQTPTIVRRQPAPDGRARAHAAEREALRAAETAVRWAGEATPLIIGGDFNLRPRATERVRARSSVRHGLAAPTAPDSLDHLLARGLEVIRPPPAWPAGAA